MKNFLKYPVIISAIWILGVLLSGCSSTVSLEQSGSPVSDSHKVVLAPEDEPGQRLTLRGTVIDSQTGNPIPNAQIYLYHADADGEYHPSDPEDESTAKLSGTVSTGLDGQFSVDTIVPREYDQPGNRHIHIQYVRADGYQDFGGVILFENDVNDEIRQWANDTGFGIIIELEEMGGVQNGEIIIKLDPGQ
jgi:protocatechuate 3,4-dioxygenase beta subunit